MSIGWIDFSKDERNKVLNVIHLLDEPGAVDELGIGPVRDGFANIFFPGTSTVQTRAKYFLIVSYILYEAGSGKYGNDLNGVIRKIDDEERKCRDILIKVSNDGVIGSQDPKSWVVRTPLNIYWSGIKKLGIFNEDLTVKEYVRQSILMNNQKNLKALGNRKAEAEENEKDDADAGDITSIRFWNLFDLYHDKWRDDLAMELKPDEADYLKTQIITSQRESLFAHVLKNGINLDKYDSFAALSEDIRDKVDQRLSYLMDLANDFNGFISVVTTRYNLIVFDGNNERAKEKWKLMANELDARSSVDLKAIFYELSIKSAKLREFLLEMQNAMHAGDIDKIDKLIKQREEKLKGPKRAKTNRIGEYREQDANWIGIDELDYRFSSAKRIIRDILNAEGGANV